MFLPGPHLTQMMCDHAAEVIRIEPPPRGEPSRHLGPAHNGHTPWFRNTHRGKKSLCLNLKTDEGREIVRTLVARSDVLIESFRPGVMERLGLDYASLAAINPSIVVCSITAFGQSGPYRSRPAHDLSVQALSGLLSVNLGGDGRPALPGVPAADMCASLMAFGAVTMALYRREKTGSGDYIDISMQDAMMAWTQNVLGPVFAEDRAHDVQNERGWGGRGFYNVYETADGHYITLSGSEPKFVANLLGALDRLDLTDMALSPPGDHQAPLIRFFADTFIQKDLDEWVLWLDGLDICFGPVLDLKQAFDDEHVRHRRMLLEDDAGSKHVGVPIKYQREPAQVRFGVPELGEHAEDVLRDNGYSSERIQSLRDAGVVFD